MIPEVKGLHIGLLERRHPPGHRGSLVEQLAPLLQSQRGRPVPVAIHAEVARAVGCGLGLRCFGCDFVSTAEGWRLVDVNAFPGYKGALGAAGAIVNEIARVAHEGGSR